MKKTLRVIGYLALFILVIVFGILAYIFISAKVASSKAMAKAGDPAPTLTIEGYTFRDLNKNGSLDIYEDSRQDIESRISDLISQMNVEEKAGMFFHNMIAMNADGSLTESPSFSNPFSLMLGNNSDAVLNKQMNHFNVLQVVAPEAMAKWHNNLQKLAERTRLGIPVTIASDPRHAFSNNPGANLFAGEFSKWPEPPGLAATRDSALVASFADIARQEYLAVGIRTALHPMADLATEPRWARVNGTFGEDAKLSALMTKAYILGFQGDSLGTHSVACMTKHFSGGGPQEGGLDAHFEYGKTQSYPGNNFDYHIIPFEEGAFPAKTAQIMPYYGIPLEQTKEEVAFGFNKEIITDLLREKYQFDGVICTDWGIISDRMVMGVIMFKEAAAWGVEDLSPKQRIQKVFEAGCDQIGGESLPELVVELINEGALEENRIDQSLRRILRDKFRLGLFDNPYVDEEKADEIVGRQDFVTAGKQAQRKSLVLLKNQAFDDGKMALPLSRNLKIYIENIDPEVAAQYGEVTSDIMEADFGIIRINTPYQPMGVGFESFFHQGDLDFKGEEKARILEILNTIPTIVDIYLERPAVIPEIADKAMGLIGDFGAEDDAVLDVIFGEFNPQGKLPFELPASMEAVRAQKEDLPYDSESPLFEYGFGLSYKK